MVRSACRWRLEVVDEGVVLPFGQGPDFCDYLGCREAILVEDGGTYHLFYDGAGPKGWLACLAVSKDLRKWERLGPVLDFGAPGEPGRPFCLRPLDDSGRGWHLAHVFTSGTPNCSPAPDLVPAFPYLTLKARANSLRGPWLKQREVRPFWVKPGTFRESTASPGAILRHGGEYLQFLQRRGLYHARQRTTGGKLRIWPRPSRRGGRVGRGPCGLWGWPAPAIWTGLGTSRTKPILPLQEQIEKLLPLF